MLVKVAFADLRDGSRVHIWGVQGPNPFFRPRNRDAERTVEAMNKWLETIRQGSAGFP